MELSKIQPLLESNNIGLIGIGLEAKGAEDFYEDKYFAGELYLDLKHEQYEELGFKKFNLCSIWCVICSKTTKEVHKKVMNMCSDFLDFTVE